MQDTTTAQAGIPTGAVTPDVELVLGDVAALTQGGEGGSVEQKRFPYG